VLKVAADETALWLPSTMAGWDACWVLVQREEELGAIEGWLNGVKEGEGGVALLEGPAGIGKTALLRAVAERAEDIGLSVLHARGGQFERSAAWAVARELLLPGLAALDCEEL
jgi:ABC-type nitrate/sulfonate/bicarbonate transport system ATPase subunit